MKQFYSFKYFIKEHHNHTMINIEKTLKKFFKYFI